MLSGVGGSPTPLKPRAFVDLHCHTNGSFDSLSDPGAAMRAASSRGLTHLAITDHDRIDAALRARDVAPLGLTIIVGAEVKTRDGDLICLFLERAIPPGLPAAEAIAAARDQGGLVGMPHPFDRFRGSVLNDRRLEDLAGAVDWVETWNARVVGRGGNERAAAFAQSHACRAWPSRTPTRLSRSGSPTASWTAIRRPPLACSPPSDRSTSCRAGQPMSLGPITPLAKLVQRARGNGRVRPAATRGRRG